MSLNKAFDQIEERLRKLVREEIEIALRTNQELTESVRDRSAKELLTTKELAALLGISPVTLFRLRKGGQVGFYRAGGRVLFSYQDHVLPYLRSTGSSSRRRPRHS